MKRSLKITLISIYFIFAVVAVFLGRKYFVQSQNEGLTKATDLIDLVSKEKKDALIQWKESLMTSAMLLRSNPNFSQRVSDLFTGVNTEHAKERIGVWFSRATQEDAFFGTALTDTSLTVKVLKTERPDLSDQILSQLSPSDLLRDMPGFSMVFRDSAGNLGLGVITPVFMSDETLEPIALVVLFVDVGDKLNSEFVESGLNEWLTYALYPVSEEPFTTPFYTNAADTFSLAKKKPEAWITRSDTIPDLQWKLTSGVSKQNIVESNRLLTRYLIWFMILIFLVLGFALALVWILQHARLIRSRYEAIRQKNETYRNYQQLFAKSPVPMWVYSIHDLKFLAVNHAAQVKYGYTREAFDSITVKELFADADESSIRALCGPNNSRMPDAMTKHRLANGELIDVDLSCQRLDWEGRTGCLMTAIDITDRAAEIRDLWDHAPCGYHSLNADGVFIRINQTELDWLGYETGDLLHKKSFKDLLTVESVQVFEKNYPVFKEKGEIKNLEFSMITKTGEILPVLLSSTAVYNQHGEYNMSRSTMINRTDLKRSRDELEKTLERLQAVNQELETFSYSVSHDLKAPLRAIDGYSKLLTEDYEDLLDEQGKHYLQAMSRAAVHMNQLINDLLAYSRLERQSMAFSDVRIRDLVGFVISTFQSPMENADYEILDEIPDIRVSANHDALLIVFRNLLDNAIKFSKNAEKPVIKLTYTNETDEHVFCVQDNGIGFDEQFSDQIFGIFQRLHTQEAYPGTGIGLSMVKKALERMGGRIWVHGKPGQGASFCFSLKKVSHN